MKKSPLKRNIASMEKGVKVNPVIELILQGSIDALNQYHIIFTPSIYHKLFIAVIVFVCVSMLIIGFPLVKMLLIDGKHFGI